ncbi:hypothetical protein BGZ49_003086 [Haplosporangium sp. Z 27]|nr:hypothetical protein BGZ49_003086 [Haplosporangium sp. Z 27]
MDQIATAQRNLEIDNISSSQKDDRYEASQRPVVMDIHLIPLDPAKPTELLLSRLDVTSGRATIQVRTEIPPGWYRLEIHFWDEGSKDDYRTLINNSGKDKAWNLQTSNLISSPGHAKPINTIMAHEVGVWRGNEAIEITTLTPELAEWTEFIETISQEARQERWNLANFDGLDFASAEAQRKRKLREMILEEHRSEEEFRMPNIFIDTPRIHDRMKSLVLGFWGKSKTGVPPDPLSSFERTNFPQEKFRFKDAMVVMSNREGTPDFLEAEIELMDDKDKEEEAKGNGPSLERIAWGKAMNELDSLMDIWSETTEIREAVGGLEENKSNDVSPSGLSDLHIRIEHGRDTVPEGSPTAWRSNRDRTVSWQTSDLIPDDVLLAIELIEAPKVNEEDDSLVMETRAELIQESLQQKRFALFTDRIPISWGASVVRMPTWVLPGTYQVRLTGIDSRGKKWVDVSQPFVVLSDPYLYS